MEDATPALPDNVEALKAMLIEIQAKYQELEEELTWANEKYRAMEMRYFGSVQYLSHI
jgi:hypothetical protein